MAADISNGSNNVYLERSEMTSTNRPGRPARAQSLHRDQAVVAYLTADESARLRAVATQQNLTVSALLRLLAVGLLTHGRATTAA